MRSCRRARCRRCRPLSGRRTPSRGGRAFRAGLRRDRHRPQRAQGDRGSPAARRSQNRRSGAETYPPPRARKATARCRAGRRRWVQSGCSSSRAQSLRSARSRRFPECWPSRAGLRPFVLPPLFSLWQSIKKRGGFFKQVQRASAKIARKFIVTSQKRQEIPAFFRFTAKSAGSGGPPSPPRLLG